jgi:hypothetical protein
MTTDAERWQMFCELWAASTELKVTQEENGFWAIRQVEPAEDVTFRPLIGETPDATIDITLARGELEGTTLKEEARRLAINVAREVVFKTLGERSDYIESALLAFAKLVLERERSKRCRKKKSYAEVVSEHPGDL